MTTPVVQPRPPWAWETASPSATLAPSGRVREYAAQKQVNEQQAIQIGMKEKAEEFKRSGSEIYR